MKLSRRHWLPLFLMFALYSCAKEYSYEGGISGAGYLVKDDHNNCTGVRVEGTYRVGSSLSDSNFLQVEVHVIKPGAYAISAASVNGYAFAATDNFTDTGVVLVKLPGNGKPLTAGTNLFTIKYDSSFCEVDVIVQDTVSVPVITGNPDHFPLTDGSHWSYDDLTFPGDSIIRTLNGTISLNGSTHKLMDEYLSFYPADNKQYFKRTGDDYFEYLSVSGGGLTSALNFSPTIYDEFNFLKENITTGTSWNSNTYTGSTISRAKVMVLRYFFQCLDDDAAVTVNGKTFIHVYKIQMTPEAADFGSAPQPTGEVHMFYYAKGVGLVYHQFFNTVKLHDVVKIRGWVVK